MERMRSTVMAMVLLAAWFVLSGCKEDLQDGEDAGDTTADMEVPDEGVVDPDADPDVDVPEADGIQDGEGDPDSDAVMDPVPDPEVDMDAEDADEPDASELPVGWVRPRCGEVLVDTCADCEGLPYVCGACDLSASCVADCALGCAGQGSYSCADNGTCTETEEECRPWLFCECPATHKQCDAGEVPTCAESCEAECPGDTLNCQGRCGNLTDDVGCCPDADGIEYRCPTYPMDNDPSACVSSCDECGPGYCVRVYDIGNAWVECREMFCCGAGYLCPTTSACVDSCSDCGAEYVAACNHRGRCVQSCDVCDSVAYGTGYSDPVVMACDGLCVNVLAARDHCGTCGNACPTGESCYDGHCCPEEELWCSDCDCCLPWEYTCSDWACGYCASP